MLGFVHCPNHYYGRYTLFDSFVQTQRNFTNESTWIFEKENNSDTKARRFF